MNSTPYTATFCSDSSQRSLLNRRMYCDAPTKSLAGKVRELLTDTRAVHSMVPR
jgi:hypothetical protein